MNRSPSVPPINGHLLGQVLKGRYRVQGFLARGATAAIYQAEDLRNGGAVAIKILIDHHETHRQRLLHEMHAIGSLDHPCIARVHDVGELDDRTPFLVLDHLPGETLGELLRRQGVAPLPLALPLLRRAALALGAAHARGIVHRDVKPDNLFLVGPVGEPHDVRVVDFGLSKGASRLTETGVAVGTAEYMAPEQVLTDPVDGRTDIYALGVVLYRTFSGQLPFEDSNKLALMSRQLLAPLPPFVPPSVTSRQRAALGSVVARALRKRPERRYPSMESLADDLARLHDGRPLQTDTAPEDDDIYLPRSDFGRHVVGSFYQLLGHAPPAWADADAEE